MSMLIGITGHQNIPTEALAYVTEQLQKVVQSYPDVIGVSSLAVGADQLFAEICLNNSATIWAVIPSADYEQTFTTEHDLAKYCSLLAKAIKQETLLFEGPSENAFLRAGQRIADLSELVLAVWDGEEAQGKGGTADIVAYAKQHGKPVLVIWPSGVKR